MSENKVTRKIFQPKKVDLFCLFGDITYEDLGDLCRLPSIVMIITLIMLGWGAQGVHTEFCLGKHMGSNFCESLKRVKDNAKRNIKEIGFGD
jgi:hypothetical protein